MAQQAGQDTAVQLVKLHELQQVGEASLALVHAEVKAALLLALGYGHGGKVVREGCELEGLPPGPGLRSPLLVPGERREQETPDTLGTSGEGHFLQGPDGDDRLLGVLHLHCRNLGLLGRDRLLTGRMR